MKPVKFRIKDYKSIQDSGDCYFDDKITILAGKNESGKTTILKALADFDGEKTFDKDNISPIGNEEAQTEVAVTFEISNDEIEEIEDEAHLIISGLGNKKTHTVKITKSAESEYSGEFDGGEVEFSQLPYDKYSSDVIMEQLKKLETPKITEWFSDISNDVDIAVVIDCLSAALKANTFVYKPENKQYSFAENQKLALQKILNDLEKYYKNMGEDKALLDKDFFQKLIERKVPYFIYFDSFEEVFPDSIDISKIEDNPWALALEEVSDFDIKQIVSDNKRKQTEYQNRVNTNFSEIFDSYWRQDDIKLTVGKDGEKIHFFINEGDTYYYPSQRSKGQQWFLSFFVKIVSKMREDYPNVILIDEPGLYLHAKAQKDLLNVLKDKFSKNIIVFSTHSPYLIQEDNLKNIRLVEKENLETKIITKYWANAKRDTLTPILTAIGLGVNDSIVDIHKNNVIVEGLEDVYYMRAFKKLLKNDEEINFINGGGASKVGLIGNILFGWGANVKYLFDFDKGGKDGKRRLMKEFRVSEKDILFCSDSDSQSTIDLLSDADFKKYFEEYIDDSVGNTNKRNSEKISDKPLTAKNFLDRVENEEIILSEESLENIRKLFSKIVFEKDLEQQR
ncbi:AAA family ATPase [Lactovum odontotermitis]